MDTLKDLVMKEILLYSIFSNIIFLFSPSINYSKLENFGIYDPHIQVSTNPMLKSEYFETTIKLKVVDFQIIF